MNTQLVELYLEAENDIKNNQYAEAFRKYESIIYEEPGNPMAHNSLGWLYKTQLDDYRQAENHYTAALSSSPDHPHAYYNYAILLYELERLEDLNRLLKKMLAFPFLDKAWVYHRHGLVRELFYAFEDAIAYFEKAMLSTLNSEKIKNYQEDVNRCKEKMELAKSHAQWLAGLKAKSQK
jgi:tetratricopeptide (TPR) repeat protein